MNSLRKKLYCYSITSLVITLIGVALRFISLTKFYDADIGYYMRGAVMPNIFHGICMLSIVLAVLAFVMLRREDDVCILYIPHQSFEIVGAIFAALGICVYVIYALFVVGSGETTPNPAENKIGEAVNWFAILFGAIGAVYFAIVASGKASKGDGSVLFGYSAILFILLALAKTYFDFETTMNSPNKLLLQITFMSIMLYLLFEFRFIIKREIPSGYAAMSLISIFFTAVCSIPGIVGYFMGIFNKGEYLICHFVVFGFLVYIVTKYCSFVASQMREYDV